MNDAFLKHTIAWVEGEIFEATLFGTFGLLLLSCSLVFWRFGETPNSKAMVVPLAMVGVFFMATAVSNISGNQKRLIQYTEAFHANQAEFVKSEKKRVENFQYLYTMTLIIAAACFVLALCFFLFTNHHVLKAIGLALIVFGLTGLVIDYFSKERADGYYDAIANEMEITQSKR